MVKLYRYPKAMHDIAATDIKCCFTHFYDFQVLLFRDVFMEFDMDGDGTITTKVNQGLRDP